MGIGMVLGSNEGKLGAVMISSHDTLLSPICVEAQAILDVVRLANRLDLTMVRICSDSLSVVSMLNGDKDVVHEVHPIIWDICAMRCNFSHLFFTHVRV